MILFWCHTRTLKDLEQALVCLNIHFTDRYESWRSSLEQPAQFDCSDNSIGIGGVNLARPTNHPGVLPVAVYMCALLEGNVVHGYTLAAPGCSDMLACPAVLGKSCHYPTTGAPSVTSPYFGFAYLPKQA